MLLWRAMGFSTLEVFVLLWMASATGHPDAQTNPCHPEFRKVF